MSRILSATVAFAVVFALGAPVHAGTLKVIHAFQGGTDGSEPQSPFAVDASGNLYGTTAFGGNGAGCPVASHGGCGTVYKIAPDGTETVVYIFLGNSDGRYPTGSLVLDEDGNLYGTTQLGGSVGCQGMGCGTVFKIAPNGDETILQSFGDGANIAQPVSGLVRDSSGNLYGAGFGGGSNHAGVIFKITPDNTLSIVHTFSGTPDEQANPNSLMIDRYNNIYGTTGVPGETQFCGNYCGTVFTVSKTGVFSTLHVFGGTEGVIPDGAPVKDSAGNLYGTTFGGGAVCDCGTIFRLASDGTLTTLHSFQGDADGKWPRGALAIDKNANVYGTTASGGVGCSGGCGTVFKLDSSGTESVLSALSKKKGITPIAGVTRVAGGTIYGTAMLRGGGEGTVFKIKP